MKPELGISDTGFGLLTGFGFALLYTVAAIPLAQLAETRHRVWIMAICITVWSVMTALCAAAQGFGQLLLFRMGVGMAEGGCVPYSQWDKAYREVMSQ